MGQSPRRKKAAARSTAASADAPAGMRPRATRASASRGKRPSQRKRTAPSKVASATSIHAHSTAPALRSSRHASTGASTSSAQPSAHASGEGGRSATGSWNGEKRIHSSATRASAGVPAARSHSIPADAPVGFASEASPPAAKARARRTARTRCDLTSAAAELAKSSTRPSGNAAWTFAQTAKRSAVAAMRPADGGVSS